MKLISGGQTGVDQAGLRVGKNMGFETGGFVPKGCRTEDGPNPDLVTIYGCVESTRSDYPARTAMNAMMADGTVWFGTIGSAGYKCTRSATGVANKPFIENPDISQLQQWLAQYKIGILNVAGTRGSHDRNGSIVRTAELVLEGALKPLAPPVRALILDQFFGPSPYDLQQQPMLFEDLIMQCEATHQPIYGHKARVEMLSWDWSPPMATTVFRANPITKMAEVWKMRWDSSG